jgi:FHS family glucose/mannose:H+ symporter-like MFS transporter
VAKRAINWVCFAVLGFLGIYLGVFQRVLDKIAFDYSLNKLHMGSLVTVHFAGLLLGPLFAGELSDKFGRKVILSSAFTIFLSGLIVIFVSQGILPLLIGIFITGVAFGILEGTITTLLTDITVGDSNKVINISQIFFSIGTMAGPFIAVAAIMLSGSWKFTYALSIVIVLFFLFAFKRYPYSDYKPAEKVEGIITIKLLKQKTFLLLCASMIMYVGIEEGLAFWMTTYAKEWAASEYYPTILLAVYWGSMILGRYIVSKFSKKLNELIIGSMIFSAVFLVIVLLTNSLIVNLISFFFIGLGFSGIWPMVMALTKEYFPVYTGTAFGIMMACSAAGGVLIPFIMGYIGEKANLKLALLFCLLPVVIIIASHIAIRYLQSGTGIETNKYLAANATGKTEE